MQRLSTRGSCTQRSASQLALEQARCHWGDPDATLSVLLGDAVSASWREPAPPRPKPNSAHQRQGAAAQGAAEHNELQGWAREGTTGGEMVDEGVSAYDGAGEEEDVYQMLDMRMQLHQLDTENLALRKKLEQQCALNKQMQEAMLLASEPAPAPVPPLSSVASSDTTFPSMPSPSTRPSHPVASTSSASSSHTFPGQPVPMPLPNAQPAQHQPPPLWPPSASSALGRPNQLPQQTHGCWKGTTEATCQPGVGRYNGAAPHDWLGDGWEASRSTEAAIHVPPLNYGAPRSAVHQQHALLSSQGSDGAIAACLEVEEYERQQHELHLFQHPQQQLQQQPWHRMQGSLPGSHAMAQPALGPARPVYKGNSSTPQSWACQACTYVHSGKEALFIRCAICGALK